MAPYTTSDKILLFLLLVGVFASCICVSLVCIVLCQSNNGIEKTKAAFIMVLTVIGFFCFCKALVDQVRKG